MRDWGRAVVVGLCVCSLGLLWLLASCGEQPPAEEPEQPEAEVSQAPEIPQEAEPQPEEEEEEEENVHLIRNPATMTEVLAGAPAVIRGEGEEAVLYLDERTIILEADLTLEHLTLEGGEEDRWCFLYANGYHLTIGEGVKVEGHLSLYGGGDEEHVESAHLTVRSGDFSTVSASGRTSGILGDALVEVFGGTVKFLSAGSNVNGVFGTSRIVVSGGTVEDFSANTSSLQNERAEPRSFVEISGGEILGDLYNGSPGTNLLTLESRLEITGGVIHGSVYGGGNWGGLSQPGASVGSAEVLVSGGEIRGDLYGGGKWNKLGSARTVITGGKIHGDVFGGGYLPGGGPVDIELEISGGEIGGLVSSGHRFGYVIGEEGTRHLRLHGREYDLEPGEMITPLGEDPGLEWKGAKDRLAVYARLPEIPHHMLVADFVCCLLEVDAEAAPEIHRLLSESPYENISLAYNRFYPASPYYTVRAVTHSLEPLDSSAYPTHGSWFLLDLEILEPGESGVPAGRGRWALNIHSPQMGGGEGGLPGPLVSYEHYALRESLAGMEGRSKLQWLAILARNTAFESTGEADPDILLNYLLLFTEENEDYRVTQEEVDRCAQIHLGLDSLVVHGSDRYEPETGLYNAWLGGGFADPGEFFTHYVDENGWDHYLYGQYRREEMEYFAGEPDFVQDYVLDGERLVRIRDVTGDWRNVAG